LTKDQQKVYNFLKDKEQAMVDDIALYLDWPMSKLAMVLLEMEMSNVVFALPGKIYRSV